MEEYKRIAKLVLVPSFFSLLPAFSVIILSYSILAGSKTEIGISIFCLFIFASALFFFAKSLSGCFFYLIFSVFISLVILLRILFLTHFYPIDDSCKNYTATVKSVKTLRYSSENVLKFLCSDKIHSGFFSSDNKAVSYTDKEIKIIPGDKILIYSKPKEISFDNQNISCFETNLLRKGFHYIFYLNNKNYKVVKHAPVSIKEKIRNSIETNLSRLFNEKTVQVIKALYFANGTYIDKSTIIDFKRAGALHILAASGEHIGIIAGALLLILSPLLVSRNFLRVIIALVLLFYLYITDMPVSLLRAFIMYYVFSIQQIFNFEKNIFNTLFISAIIILIISPYDLYNLGFQLSFGATFGILLFHNFYKDIFSSLSSKIPGILSVTFSAQVFVLPIIFIQLNEINLAGLLSNIILVFTMSGTMMFSIITNLISVIAFMPAKYLAVFTDFLYSLSLKVVQYFSGINGHFVTDSSVGFFLLIPFILFLIPIMPLKLNKKLQGFSLIIAVLSAWLMLSGFYTTTNNKITITGTDEKVIIIQKENHNPIIFGNISAFEDADCIAHYLNKNNIRNIDLCIPSPDFDNLRNFSYLIKKTLVARCFIAPEFMFTGYFKKFCRTLDTDGIALKIQKFKTYSADELKGIGRPEYAKNMLLTPLENIAELHYLFSADYDFKNALAGNFIKSGYEVEYLE
ncbi:MAG: ComEC/Rec2 family competence protein [Spirochaetes bacterium]|nr:ComEC/Rec2 family competence protein [Spirochaetota bacterium]